MLKKNDLRQIDFMIKKINKWQINAYVQCIENFFNLRLKPQQ